jgi:DNA-binding NtrC family response regulator
MSPLRVLVVDEDSATCLSLQAAAEARGHTCAYVRSAQEAEKYVREHALDLVLIDIYLGPASGIDLLQRIRAMQPNCYCVVMTAYISMETAAQSVSEGAVEYQHKPLPADEFAAMLERAQSYREARLISRPPVSSTEPAHYSAIIGNGAKMLEVYRAIARVAPSDAHVLVTGASGTGKELVARAIHDYSKRKDKLFTPVNCGSLPETLLESELFGHEKGAFTGASVARKGLIETTDGGTLFLDEITETSPGFQVKLLRFIQEQQVRRLGSNKILPVNVRVLAASNRDIDAMVAAREFRGDLFYRLSVVQITLPSLRERREDIPPLADHFLRRFNQRNRQEVAIDAAAVDALCQMDWPGNVRELENMVQRLAIFSSGGVIRPSDVERLRIRTIEPVALASSVSAAASASAPRKMDRLIDFEREHILRVLAESGGNRSEAARRLGIERKTLYKKAIRLGIDLNRREKSS